LLPLLYCSCCASWFDDFAAGGPAAKCDCIFRAYFDTIRLLIMISNRTIRTYAHRIARRYRPDLIILFGSRAQGTARADSDVDLLIVMPIRQRASYVAADIQTQIPAPFPVDILVRSPQQIDRRLAIRDPFIADVMQRGKTLYESSRK